MSWDANPELMSEIYASIQPVETEVPLRQALAEHFPGDCADLPISGGWGYTQATAIVFVLSQFSNAIYARNFVSLEYQVAKKIIYEELIIFRPENYRFSGITMDLKLQSLIGSGERTYDKLEFEVACWSDWHSEQLKAEWEANENGQRAGFNLQAHQAKREASHVRYEREFWFNITEVFDGVAIFQTRPGPPNPPHHLVWRRVRDRTRKEWP
jgi:hypothetical protein